MRPHADFLDFWRSFAPVPRHVLQGVAPAALRNHPFGTRQPLGNGPFRFVSRTPGQNWTFAANRDFPRALGGRPYLDRLVYRPIPEPNTLVTELLTGGVDLYIAPPAEQAEMIRTSDAARLITFPDRAYVYIAWNHRSPWFRDARVRRALTLAIDRQRIIDGVLGGSGTLANSTVPPFFWQHDSQAGRDLGHDPALARRLLAEAGYVDRDGDGILEDARGRPFRFSLKSNQGNRIRSDIAQVVQADLRKVGIDARPEIVEWGTLLDQVTTPARREFDAVTFGYVPEFRMDDSDILHCARRDEPHHLSGYCNPQVDRLLDTLPRIVDRQAAKPLWVQYQRRIAADQPFTPLYFQQRREGVSNRLRGVDPDARGDLVGVNRWYVVRGP